MKKILIAGLDADTFGIGFQGQLLHRNRFDMQRFKSFTSGHAILVGHKTFQGMGELKSRFNIVVSKSKTYSSDTCVFVDSIEKGELLAQEKGYSQLWIIGGSFIYKHYISTKSYDQMELTFFPSKPLPIDTFFPRFDWSEHRVVGQVVDGVDYKTLVRIQNLAEEKYICLLRNILESGSFESGRNANTYSIFGQSLTFDLQEGFPLLTTKRVWFKGVFEELLWFLGNSIDVKILREKGVHIWDGNTTREFLDKNHLNQYQEYEAGPIYGFQWRHWNAEYKGLDHDYSGEGIDQIADCIKMIKEDPYSRRILFTGWNPEQLSQMALPPCHVLYQFNVSQGKYLDCQMYQRSADVFLGVPFNIASVALLTTFVAHQTSLLPGKITCCFGNVHIYEQHLEAVKEQITRIPGKFPTLEIRGNVPKDIREYELKNVKVVNYNPQATIKAAMIA